MPETQNRTQIPELRAQLAEILHQANTGLITRDSGDHTHYEAMAEAMIDHFLRSPSRASTLGRSFCAP